MASDVKMRALLEAGVHFGHRTNKWNPKMDEFIFTSRNGIHIINLTKTLSNINRYYDEIVRIVANGGSILFVGTKRQAQETIAREADRCNMPYVNTRWLGGMLTNWRTIRERIETLKKLEKRREAGEFERLTKKEALILERKIAKLQHRLGGIRNMKRVPELIIIVDTEREYTAVKEANVLQIPILGIIDTDGNPDNVDYVIPANDDAMRSIHLLVSTFADAVIEGKKARGGDEEDDVEEFESIIAFNDDEMDEDDLLGEKTLAKLRDQKLFSSEDDGDDDE
ncbi:30S ribosomal protein S2 [Anaerolineales bacterium]